MKYKEVIYIKIGFIGSQGSGKTTKAYEFATVLKKAGHDVSVITEVARSCPLPINERTTKASQLWIMGKQMTREQSIKSNIIITDRTILDSFCYSSRIDIEFFKHFEQMIKKYMETYDIVFYLPPNDNYLVDDGTRSIDKQFRNEIDCIMNNYIDKLSIKIYQVDNINSMLEIFNNIHCG